MKRPRPYRFFANGALLPLILSLTLVLPATAQPPVLEESLSLQALIDLPENQLATIDIEI